VKGEGWNCESGCDGLMPVKAIALLSGGLDSTLAAVLVRRAGIDVIGLHVQILFGKDSDRCRYVARTAEGVGIPLRSLDLSEEQMKRVCYPRHGYGSGMNPCIDCRILMLTAAKRVMEEEGAQFVVTGEVLGQRPMSQHRRSLELVAEESGLGDRLLRPPLGQNRLPETLPREKGMDSPRSSIGPVRAESPRANCTSPLALASPSSPSRQGDACCWKRPSPLV